MDGVAIRQIEILIDGRRSCNHVDFTEISIKAYGNDPLEPKIQLLQNFVIVV